MSRQLRSAASVFMFCLLTLINGLIALVLGGLLSLIFWWRADHLLWWLPCTWGNQLKQYCTDPIGLKWDSYCLEKDLRQKGGLKIVICNHPPTLITWAALYITGLHVSGRIAMVLKSSNLLNPIGLGLAGLRSGIFVSRLYEVWPFRRWSWLQQKLRSFSQRWYRWQVKRLVKRASRIKGGVAVMIFPDQRLKPGRKDAYVQKYGRDIPDLADWTVTLLPKAGGLMELLQACAGLPVTVVDMTIVLKAEHAEGWTNFDPYHNSTVMVMIEEITAELQAEAPDGDLSRFAEEPGQLRDWLNRRFRIKNTVGYGWRNLNARRSRR